MNEVEKNYTITEQVKSWVVTCKRGAVTLEYSVTAPLLHVTTHDLTCSVMV